MKIKVIFFAPLLLVGCAQSSGVLKMGPDTYSISVHAAPARGGESGARSLAMEEAHTHCSSFNKEIVVTNISSYASTHLPGGTADIIFQCLDSDDPELQRPKYRNAPDVLIENNN